MATQNRMYGSHGQIQADPTGGSTLATIASIAAWTLNMARNKADVTCFGDSNLVYVQGLPDIKGTFSGWFDTDPAQVVIWDIALGVVAAALSLTPTTLSPSMKWAGLGWLDAAIDVKATGAVAISGNFVAAGPWTRVAVP